MKLDKYGSAGFTFCQDCRANVTKDNGFVVRGDRAVRVGVTLCRECAQKVADKMGWTI